MKTTKRLLALLLTFCMLATTLCLPTFAADEAPAMTTTTKTSVLKNVGDGMPYNLETVLTDGVSDVKVIDSGDDCIVMRGTVTSGGQVNAYCNKLLADGFKPYCATKGTDVIGYVLGLSGGAARHQTYANEIYLVNVFWSNKLAKNTLTVTWEPLPFKKAETEANADYLSVFTAPQAVEKVCEPVAIQMGLDVEGATESDGSAAELRSGMSYVFRLSDGSFVIYDGGVDQATTPSDNEHGPGGTALRKNMNRLLDVLNTYAVDKNDIRIAAWVITHPHTDHYRLFERVVKEMYTEEAYFENYANITLERVITNYPSYEQLDNCTDANYTTDCDVLTEAGLANRRASLATCEKNGVYLYKAHVGQTYYLADAELTILYTEDIALTASGNEGCSHTSGDQSQTNRLSIISQLTLPVNGYDVKFMITGDAEGDVIDTVNDVYGTALKSDFVQAPHHGNIDTQTSALKTFYETNVKAAYLLVPTSDDWWNGTTSSTISYAPLYTKHKAGTATNYTCQYADTIGLANTFIAGSAAREFEMTVTDGVLSVTPAVLVFGGCDIDTYVTKAASHFKLISDITTDKALHLDFAFSGTLDGMGHTLTIKGGYSASGSYGMLFKSLSGATIKNIQIGTEKFPMTHEKTDQSNGWNVGVLGNNATGVVTISNVSIWADFTVAEGTGTAGNLGVFLGKIEDKNGTGKVTFENCVANGTITSTSRTKADTYAGFVGSAANAVSITFTNCTNNTNITSANKNNLNAGFVGKDTANCAALTFENCVNNGAISGVGISAGILAKCVGPAVSMNGVVNYGDVKGVEGSVGSMVGTSSGTLTAEGCVNVGKLNDNVVSEDGIVGAVTQTNKGAGVRIALDGKGSGLRFKFTMDDASIATLAALTEAYGANNVEVGAIFLPTQLLTRGDLTAENYSNARIMTGKASALEDGYYHASLVNLYEANYNVAYSCQSFWRFRTSAEGEWITVYANNTESRTIAGVADAFLADPNVDFSRYTAEQMKLVNDYAAANN